MQRGSMTKDLCTVGKEFGYFPKSSRKALSCFEPGEVSTDTHFGELSGWRMLSRLEMNNTWGLKTQISDQASDPKRGLYAHA